MGNNEYGQISIADAPTYQAAPFEVNLGATIKEIRLSEAAICGLSTSGTIICQGSPVGSSAPGLHTLSEFGTISTFDQTGNQICAVRSSGGAVFCKGLNLDGESGTNPTPSGCNFPLPDGCFLIVSTPVQASGLSASNVSIGPGKVCATRTNGNLACWGRGTDYPNWVPTDTGLKEVRSIELSETHQCALMVAKQIRCSGIRDLQSSGNFTYMNNLGQDWAGTTTTETTENSPTLVARSNNATALSVSRNLSCAIVRNGERYCIGRGIFEFDTAPEDQLPALPQGFAFAMLAVQQSIPLSSFDPQIEVDGSSIRQVFTTNDVRQPLPGQARTLTSKFAVQVAGEEEEPAEMECRIQGGSWGACSPSSAPEAETADWTNNRSYQDNRRVWEDGPDNEIDHDWNWFVENSEFVEASTNAVEPGSYEIEAREVETDQSVAIKTEVRPYPEDPWAWALNPPVEDGLGIWLDLDDFRSIRNYAPKPVKILSAPNALKPAKAQSNVGAGIASLPTYAYSGPTVSSDQLEAMGRFPFRFSTDQNPQSDLLGQIQGIGTAYGEQYGPTTSYECALLDDRDGSAPVWLYGDPASIRWQPCSDGVLFRDLEKAVSGSSSLRQIRFLVRGRNEVMAGPASSFTFGVVDLKQCKLSDVRARFFIFKGYKNKKLNAVRLVSRYKASAAGVVQVSFFERKKNGKIGKKLGSSNAKFKKTGVRGNGGYQLFRIRLAKKPKVMNHLRKSRTGFVAKLRVKNAPNYCQRFQKTELQLTQKKRFYDQFVWFQTGSFKNKTIKRGGSTLG